MDMAGSCGRSCVLGKLALAGSGEGPGKLSDFEATWYLTSSQLGIYSKMEWKQPRTRSELGDESEKIPSWRGLRFCYIQVEPNRRPRTSSTDLSSER